MVVTNDQNLQQTKQMIVLQVEQTNLKNSFCNVTEQQGLNLMKQLYELQIPKIQLNKGVIQTNGQLIQFCEHINRNSFCTVYECLHDKPFNTAFECAFYKNPLEHKTKKYLSFDFKPNISLNVSNQNKKYYLKFKKI